MNKIEVKVLNEAHANPDGMMMFLAKLTQRGHTINSMSDLETLYTQCVTKTDWKTALNVAKMPHGTIKRFMPITVAIVGASRRFLAQARTHAIGLDFVSASLQYSDYSGAGSDKFCVPYDIMNAELAGATFVQHSHTKGVYNVTPTDWFISSCNSAMDDYEALIKGYGIDNDAAGYVAPQALRNILIIQGNHEAWDNFINKRSCLRNTKETAYVAGLIWEALYNTTGGDTFFRLSGPDCVKAVCREGHMCCGTPLITLKNADGNSNSGSNYINYVFDVVKEYDKLHGGTLHERSNA